MQNEYKKVHQLICSNCGSRALSSSYSSDMEENNISIICDRCGANTEVGRVDNKLDKHFMLVHTPNLEKSEIQIGLTKKHNDRFFKLIEKDRTVDTDRERKALFFVISGVTDLYNKVDRLYDFKSHWIKDDCFEKEFFSSSQKKLLQLAFNLYNNSNAPAPLDLFSNLDNESYILAMKAINIRFNKI